MFTGEPFNESLNKRLVSAFNEKGWNLYDARLVDEKRIDGRVDVIRRGAVSRLELDVRYTVLPKVLEDTSPEAVFAALTRYRMMPSLAFPDSRFITQELPDLAMTFSDGTEAPVHESHYLRKGEKVLFTGLTPEAHSVRITSPWITILSYEQLFEGLEYLPVLDSKDTA